MAELDKDTRYRVRGYGGVAWSYYGPETVGYMTEDGDMPEPEDRIPTGMVEMVMVGDDRIFIIDPSDVEPLADDEYCPSCGQIGCKW